MSGRHAAAPDVDDEARAAAEPDTPGAHRAEVDPARAVKPPPKKPAQTRATAPQATPPRAGRATKRS